MSTRGMKFAFVGASYLFVYKVIKDLANCGAFAGSRIDIYDIDSEPAEVIAAIGRRISDALGAGFDVRAQTDRRAALSGADVVIVCISVGGRQAGKADIGICRRYGCDHVIGDTIGPAALSRNLRMYPVVRDLAQAIETCCPKAIVVNFTNPMSVTTATLARNTSARVIGLCHGAVAVAGSIAKAYDVGVGDVRMELGGVNHFSFVLRVTIQGRDVPMADVIDRLGRNGHQDGRDVATGAALHMPYSLELARRLGYLPNNHDRHTVEFFSWFLHPWKKLHTSELADYDARIRDHAELAAYCKQLASGQCEVPDLRADSGEDAEGIILAMQGDQPQRFGLNYPNQGSIAGLADDAMVEVYKQVSSRGIVSEPTLTLPAHLFSIIHRLVTIHEYTMEAARTGRRELAMQALMLEANLPDFDAAPAMLDELLANNVLVLERLGYQPTLR